MKVRLLKDYNQLSKRSQRKIAEAIVNEKLESADQDLVWVQKMMLQVGCIILNQKPRGFGKMRLLLWLGGWNEQFRILGQFKTRAEQDEYLNTEMRRIFGKDGFPYQYLEKLEKM